jgi:hypothetical protein
MIDGRKKPLPPSKIKNINETRHTVALGSLSIFGQVTGKPKSCQILHHKAGKFKGIALSHLSNNRQ